MLTMKSNLVSLRPALLVAIAAVNRSCSIRLERYFCFDATFGTSDLVHFSRWAIVSAAAASVKIISIHV